MVYRLVKKFAASDRNPKLKFCFIKVRCWSHFCPKRMETISPHTFYLRSILPLNSFLHLVLQRELFSSALWTDILDVFLITHMHATYSVHLILHGMITITVGSKKTKLWSLSFCCFSSASFCLLPLRFRYSTKHPLLRHSQSFSSFLCVRK